MPKYHAIYDKEGKDDPAAVTRDRGLADRINMRVFNGKARVEDVEE